MKKYTHNNAGIRIAEESRLYVNDGFGELCFPVPFAVIKGDITMYPLRKDENLNPRLISEMEGKGHLVVSRSELIKRNGNAVRESGDINLRLSVPETETGDLYAYIGISAGQVEAIASYPMFKDEIQANSKLVIDGDFGANTMDQIADLAKHHTLELTELGLDGETDNKFISEKLLHSGRQTDGDRLKENPFRFKQNDQYTTNTGDRMMRLGSGTKAGVVILDGMRFLRVKVLKSSPVNLTLYYNHIG